MFRYNDNRSALFVLAVAAIAIIAALSDLTVLVAAEGNETDVDDVFEGDDDMIAEMEGNATWMDGNMTGDIEASAVATAASLFAATIASMVTLMQL